MNKADFFLILSQAKGLVDALGRHRNPGKAIIVNEAVSIIHLSYLKEVSYLMIKFHGQFGICN